MRKKLYFANELQDKEVSLKIHFWLVVVNNALLAISYYVIYGLYKSDIYNPWCSINMSTLLLPEEWFRGSLIWMTLLLVAATLPTLIVGVSLTCWSW